MNVFPRTQENAKEMRVSQDKRHLNDPGKCNMSLQSTIPKTHNLERLFQHANVEEQATCFVLHNYVSKHSDSFGEASSPMWGVHEQGLFAYLPGMCRGVQKNRHLEDAVIALGLAGISNTRHEVGLMRKAGLRNTSAVRGISAKLEQADEAMKDEILTAVLLLGLYEVSFDVQNEDEQEEQADL